MVEFAEVIHAANAIANIGIVFILPFILWMLSDIKRNIRDIEGKSLESLFRRLERVETRSEVQEAMIEIIRSELAAKIQDG